MHLSVFAEWESSELFPLVCLTLQGTILCCHPQLFFCGYYHFGNCVSHWSEWLLSMAPGFVVGETMNFIWFDFSPSERRIERIFLRPQLPSVRLSDDMPPWNKQTNRSLQMIFVCEKNTWLHMLVWVSFFHIVWAFLFSACACVCVCIRLGTDLSSSWQTPSTATAGPQPVDAARPKLQERSRGPKIFPWPLKALLIFTVSCF